MKMVFVLRFLSHRSEIPFRRFPLERVFVGLAAFAFRLLVIGFFF